MAEQQTVAILLADHAKAKLEKPVLCQSGTLEQFHQTERIFVEVVEKDYLAAASGTGDLSAARGNEWLVSDGWRLSPTETAFDTRHSGRLSQSDLVAVVSVDPTSDAKHKVGRLTLHGLPGGRGLCGTTFSVPKAGSEAASRAAFLTALKKGATGLSPRLVLRLDSK